MRVTIIKDDGVVGVDGVFKHVGLESLDPAISAVQWNGTSGHIEYYDEQTPNTLIDSFAEFQSFVDAYNEPDEIVTPAEVVPTILNMAQARLALLQSGYLAQVDAMIAALPGMEGDAARVEWEFRETVVRSHPLVAAIAAAIPLTESQLDDLFTLAASL